MRKSILIAAALSVLAGCGKSFEPEVKDNSHLITFGQPRVSVLTRSEGDYVQFPQRQTFGVFAQEQNGSRWAASRGVYMYNYDSNRNLRGAVVYPSNQVWSAVNHFYWPTDETVLQFLAYAPADLSDYAYEREGLSPLLRIDTKKGILISDVRTKTFVENGVEPLPLLFSDRIANQTLVVEEGGKSRPVEVRFRHALSKVSVSLSFRPGKNNAEVYLYGMVLYGVHTIGDFSQNLDQGDPDTGLPEWTLTHLEKEEGIEFPTYGETRLIQGEPLQFPPVLVIPQDFNKENCQDAFLSLDIGFQSETGSWVYPTITVRLDSIFPENVTKFEMGKEYVINITLDGDGKGFTFNPLVVDWEVTPRRELVVCPTN